MRNKILIKERNEKVIEAEQKTNVRKMDSKITDHPGKEKIRKRERHERNEADKTSGDISEGAQVKQ